MKNIAIVLIGLSSACALLKPGQNPTNDPLLIVSSDSVSMDEFLYAFNKNRPLDSAVSRAEIDEYLDLYINFKLKVSEAKSRGLDTTAAFKKEYNSYIDQLDNSYIQISGNTDSLVVEAYNRMQYEINASHILLNLDEAAMPKDTLKVFNRAIAIRDSIVSGQKSFEDIAVAQSQDPSARQNKGNLGYFSVFQMVYPFETAAYTTSVGEISYPTRTQFGYHLVKVNDKRPNEGRIRVAHIMIRGSNDAETRAYEIYNQLLAGSDWDALCAKYSEDAQSAPRGGELMPFSRGQIVPQFADAAFGLTSPNEITEPVQTPYGWHIIKLIERLPVGDFANNEQQIKAKVRRDSRAQVSKNKMLLELAKQNNMIENDSILQQVINPENHLFEANKWVLDNDTLSSKVLFSINDKPYLVESYYRFIEQSSRHQQTKSFLFEQYKKFKSEQLIAYEKANLDKKFPEYTYLKQEYYDGILLFSIMENEVWQKASTDSIGLANFYNEHKEEYRDSTTIEVLIFTSDVRSDLDSVASIVIDYDDYLNLSEAEKDLLINNNNDSTLLSLQFEQGEFDLNNHPVIVSLDNGMSGIVQVEEEWHYVVPVRLPEEPRRIELIKGQLIAGYQETLEKNWMQELKAKYTIDIDNEVLDKVYDKLDAL
jgi:peptidyl-prolyl cis-trans isomerase SurA